MSEPIEVHFTYTADEYVRALQRHYRSALDVQRDVMGGLIAVVGGLCLLGFSDMKWLGWAVFSVGAVLLIMVAYAAFLLPKVIYNSQPKLRNEYHLSFADEGIRFLTTGIDARLDWSVYRSWLQDPEFYILYHGRRDLTVIPRRALNFDNADERFADLLRHKIGIETT